MQFCYGMSVFREYFRMHRNAKNRAWKVGHFGKPLTKLYASFVFYLQQRFWGWRKTVLESMYCSTWVKCMSTRFLPTNCWSLPSQNIVVVLPWDLWRVIRWMERSEWRALHGVGVSGDGHLGDHDHFPENSEQKLLICCVFSLTRDGASTPPDLTAQNCF